MKNTLNVLRQSLKRASGVWAAHRDPNKYARGLGVKVGKRCRFLGCGASTFGSEPYLITIGDHVTITSGVRFVTHDGGVWVLRDEVPSLDYFAPIIVGNNVFIGLEALIMPGVTIGNNAIIAARAVVTRDVAEDTIVAGVPAKAVTTLANYRSKSISRGFYTKGMTVSEKRQYLESYFSARPTPDASGGPPLMGEDPA